MIPGRRGTELGATGHRPARWIARRWRIIRLVRRCVRGHALAMGGMLRSQIPPPVVFRRRLIGVVALVAEVIVVGHGGHAHP